jgi:iron(III) transport system substrate-binding protein
MKYIACAIVSAGLLVALGCNSKPPEEVVVYTALDSQFSTPLLDDFTARTGIRVRAAYDTESTKTVGLANRIRSEAARPRCDVFWNNELLNTLRLDREGLLQACQPANARQYPPQFRDPNGHWYGFASRARVLIVNTERVAEADRPKSIRALGDPRWRGQTGIAKPLFGTTATHVACLFAKLGEAEARQLLDSFRANEIQILGGNKGCAEAVGRGQLALALTDTDDAIEEVDAGHPVQIIFPDQGAGEMGTLLLPNALAVIKDAPHADAAARLIDYLLSAEVEGRLAEGPSAQIPLNRLVQKRPRVLPPGDLRPMDVDFARAAELFPVAARYIEETFLAGTP